jgi:hypothetical protein
MPNIDNQFIKDYWFNNNINDAIKIETVNFELTKDIAEHEKKDFTDFCDKLDTILYKNN